MHALLLQLQRIIKSDCQQMKLSKWPTSMEGFDNRFHPVPTPTLLPFRTVHPHPQIAGLVPHVEFAWDSKSAAHALASWKYSSTLAPDPLLPAQRNRHPYIVNVWKKNSSNYNASAVLSPYTLMGGWGGHRAMGDGWVGTDWLLYDAAKANLNNHKFSRVRKVLMEAEA